MDAGTPITKLLHQWRAGDLQALENVTPLVYDKLRRLAAGRLRRERNARTLQPTALVHEAFLRMAGNPPACENRSHLFGIVSHVMRQVIQQYARARNSAKRGAGLAAEPLERHSIAANAAPDLLCDALNSLREHDSRKAHIVELRYFGGFTVSEIAAQLQLSISTIERDLRLALAWVHREMTS